jgi:hypothetical protein
MEWIGVDPEEAFHFLDRLENHWLVADRFVDLVSVSLEGSAPAASGGSVVIRAPLGLRRTAVTQVVRKEPPHLIEGTAAVGPATRANVRWLLEPDAGGSRVRLEAVVTRAGALDRLALRLGGRLWLARRFRVTLARLKLLLEGSG